VKRDVSLGANGRVIIRANAVDAVARVRAMKLRDKVSSGRRLSDEERDWLLLALMQALGVES
jgi:alkylhydroperoxidase/carboxymuconolactone decarboxylase family protein YurZ